MRSLLSLLLAFVVATSALLLSGGGVAHAAFHCMRIHAVMGGFNGNNNIQYVELRMDSDFGGLAPQKFLAGHTIKFFNDAGMLQATFTFPAGTFPLGASVANGAVGDSVLIATDDFNSNVTGGTSDFTFIAAGPGANTTGPSAENPVQVLPAGGGRIVFADGFGGWPGVVPVDSVAYGGVLGPYPPAAAALPSPGTNQALRLSNLNLTPMNNSTEYGLNPVSASTFSVAPANLATDFATPRNNSRTVLMLNATPPSVGGIAEEPRAALLPAVADESSDSPSRMYLVGGAAFGALILLGSGWYVYRRRRA
jgi:hypothetical protein